MNRLHSLAAVAAAAAALLLTACSGGGGSAPAPSTPPPAAQSVRVVSNGTVTGFGSVFVNGVRYDTSSSQFVINGQSGTQAELRVGHVVRVEARRDDAGRFVADRITFDDLVKGPVTSVNIAAGRLLVLGQTVLTDPETSFDDNIPTTSLAGLTAGDIVEVSGLRRADGSIQATRIERKPAGTLFEVLGSASQVDTNARRFRINALTVNYSAASVQNFPSGQPREGDFLEAKGSSLSAAGELVASSIEFKRVDDFGGVGMQVEIEGLITRFASTTDFDVAGKRVTTSSATQYEGGTPADLALNVKVEVEGRIDSAGVLVASKVQFKRQSSSRIAARVEAVDRAANRLVVLGIDVTVNAATRVEDKSDMRVTNFSLADIVVGDYVEVRGAELPAGSNDVVASRLERRRLDNEVEVRGVVDSVTRPSLMILGVTIQTNSSTQFEDAADAPISSDAFFAAAAGRNVAAKGTLSGGIFIARELEFEND
jgi:hypothetical protein